MDRDKVSHAHLYRPALDRADFHRGLLDHLVGDLMRREAEVTVQAFVDLTERLAPDQLAAIEEAIAKRRSGSSG